MKIFQPFIEIITVILGIVLFMLPFAIIFGLIEKSKKRFYVVVSERYNLKYLEKIQVSLMKGFRSELFKYSRTIKIEGVFEGKYREHIFHIFQKIFYLKDVSKYAVKSSKVLTVCSCEFGTTEFPHILLKNKKTPLWQDLKKTRKISIEENYLKDFDLYCSENYEIEALQIFTEDILQSIQLISKNFSIEFGGNRMYIYIDKKILNKKHEKEIANFINIIKEIIDKTDGLLFRLKNDFEALDSYFKK